MADLEFSPVNGLVADNLEMSPHLGGMPETTPADEQGDFRARLHERPIALSLKDLLTREKRAITAKLYRRFDLWLVPHRFSVFRVSGSSSITKVSCEVEYLNEDQTLSIISLMPSAEFVEGFGASLNVEAKINASLNETGALEVASEAFADNALALIPGSTNLSASVKVSGETKINLSMKIITPFISTIGTGSTKCIFQFTAHLEPLFDRDIETWAIIALPKHAEDVGYNLRCSFMSRRFFAPRLWQTPWAEIRASKAS